MSVQEEFSTVDLILHSSSETRCVDAFALSLIKVEKQARRLFTFLVYQHDWCGPASRSAIVDALAQSNKVYFEGIVMGWDTLYPLSVEQLVGADYLRLRGRVHEATGHRNKIFHGQLTGQDLGRPALEAFVKDLRSWCHALGNGAKSEVGYDGCGRDSLHKATNAAALSASYKINLSDLKGYRQFIRSHMERAQGKKRRT